MLLSDARSGAPLFDAYLMVDWSANSKPKTGKDSIWYFLLRRTSQGKQIDGPHNSATRHSAVEAIQTILETQAKSGQKTLVGFDFPYGYPSGFAEALGLSGKPWRAVWNALQRQIKDNEHNQSNRFELAAALNETLGPGKHLFWGCPNSKAAACLSPFKPKPWSRQVREFRLTDNWLHGPQSPWKLYAPGSVGSQALLGIPYLAYLRNAPGLKAFSRVWPFETGLKAPDFNDYSIVHAEIYPSLIPVEVSEGEIKDANQVWELADHFARVDEHSKLTRLFEGPPSLTPEQHRQVEHEEGWILGVGAEPKA